MKKLNAFIYSIIFMIVLFFGFQISSAAEVSASSDKVIQIISYNDFHGSMTEAEKNLGVEKFMSVIEAEKQKNPNTIVVSAGDNYQGSFMSNTTNGKAVNDMMKSLGVVASAVGNHEFDWGFNNFITWEKQGGFDFLAANIVYKDTQKAVEWAKPYKMITQDGVKIAFIGLTTNETTLKGGPQIAATFKFLDATETAKKWVKYLKSGKAPEGKADVIIALTHIRSIQEGNGTDLTKTITGEEIEKLCQEVPGLNGVISAHSHNEVAGYINNVPVVQAYYNGRDLGKLTITLNSDNTVKSVVPECDVYYKTKSNITPSANGTAIFSKWNKKLSPISDKVLGTATKELAHDRNKYNVSVLGSWVTELMAKKMGTQIGMLNGGTLRREIPAGKITYGLLYEVVPFDNTVVTMKLKGKDLYKAIEYSTSNEKVGNGQYYGIKVYYNPNKDFGSRVIKITLLDGTPIDNNKYYSVTMDDYMAANGDGFDFTNAKNVKDSYVLVRDLLKKGILEQKVLKPHAVDYVVQTNANSADELLAKTTWRTKDLSMSFTGEYILPSGLTFNNTAFGGISGFDYDTNSNRFFALSDDRSEKNAARFYELSMDIDSSSIKDVSVNKVTTILNPTGNTYATKEVDPESIRFNPITQEFYWSSEGDANKLQAPFIRIMNLDGTYSGEFSISNKYLPTADKSSGIVNNKAFEAIALSPDKSTMFVAIENALYQDGNAASLLSSSPVRIMKYDVKSKRLLGEYVYVVSSIPKEFINSEGYNDNGLSEFIALDNNRLLTVERSYASGIGYTVKLHVIDLTNATDVNNLYKLSDSTKTIIPARKTFLMDFDDLGLKIENIEGVTYGPNVNGKKTLIFVSDNNFSDKERTQFLAFTIN